MAASSTQIWELGAKALAERIARGELGALDVVEEHIARIEEVNSRINAVVWTRYDEARAEAREIDRRRDEGKPLGPLAGVPITIKECLVLVGSPSTLGVRGRGAHGGERDDEYAARLLSAGAIFLAKTTAAQCLFFTEPDTPFYGCCNHPADPERSPGG